MSVIGIVDGLTGNSARVLARQDGHEALVTLTESQGPESSASSQGHCFSVASGIIAVTSAANEVPFIYLNNNSGSFTLRLSRLRISATQAFQARLYLTNTVADWTFGGTAMTAYTPVNRNASSGLQPTGLVASHFATGATLTGQGVADRVEQVTSPIGLVLLDVTNTIVIPPGAGLVFTAEVDTNGNVGASLIFYRDERE